MADTATNPAQQLTEAYNKVISSSFAAADASIAQAAGTARLLTDVAQVERDEYGKAMKQAADHARTRGENIAAAIQGMAAAPAPTAPSIAPEAKDAFYKLVEGEMAFYQAWTRSWMDYFAGAESRRNAAVKSMVESNAGAMESGQEIVKSAVKCGEAFIDWSMEAAKTAKS